MEYWTARTDHTMQGEKDQNLAGGSVENTETCSGGDEYL